MSKTFCIHPKDMTTEFLTPVFEAIVKFNDTEGISDDSSEDYFYDLRTNALADPNIDSIIFLGHGSGSLLYGNGFSELINEGELSAINDKTLIIFACNSSQLLKKIVAQRGIGFGFIPSGIDDISHSSQFHNNDLSVLEFEDWICLRNIYQKVWLRALNGLDSITNVYGLYKRLSLFFNRAIVEVLQDRKMNNNKLISHILFYINKEMNMFGV